MSSSIAVAPAAIIRNSQNLLENIAERVKTEVSWEAGAVPAKPRKIGTGKK